MGLEVTLLSYFQPRIVRAFLIEEQKIVAKVLKAQQAAVKTSKVKA